MTTKTKLTPVVTMDDQLHAVTKYKDKIVMLDDALKARDDLVASQRKKIMDLRDEKYSLLAQVDQFQLDLEIEKDSVSNMFVEKKQLQNMLEKKQK